MNFFDRLCARINPPMPDALQREMLIYVAYIAYWKREFRHEYRGIVL